MRAGALVMGFCGRAKGGAEGKVALKFGSRVLGRREPPTAPPKKLVALNLMLGEAEAEISTWLLPVTLDLGVGGSGNLG